MIQQITTYNQHGHPVVLEMNPEKDIIVYDRYHNPTVVHDGYGYTETKEGWITTFKK